MVNGALKKMSTVIAAAAFGLGALAAPNTAEAGRSMVPYNALVYTGTQSCYGQFGGLGAGNKCAAGNYIEFVVPLEVETTSHSPQIGLHAADSNGIACSLLSTNQAGTSASQSGWQYNMTAGTTTVLNFGSFAATNNGGYTLLCYAYGGSYITSIAW